MPGYGETALVRSLGYLAEKQAAIANNLANVDTTSFKRRLSVAQEAPSPFEALLDAQLPTVAYSERSDLGRGIVRETGNRFDVAIDGPYWLRVQDAAGNRYYTRDGRLQIDGQGRLVTRNGQAVLDQAGLPIALGGGDSLPSDLDISPNGTVQDPSTGRTLGRLALASLPRPEALQPVGRGLYVDPENQAPGQGGDGLQQGYLEGSNVDSLQELVQMITVERTFAASQRALSGLGRMQENLIANVLR